MITYFQALILGLLQGVSELFPVSSLGHSVLLPPLLGWSIDQESNFFVGFLIITHLATALVLLGFFFKDWLRVVKGLWITVKERKINPENMYGKLGWIIILTTIPVGILGLLFEHKVRSLFASPVYVSIFLILNGLMLYAVEKVFARNTTESPTENNENVDAEITKLTWGKSLKVGIAQCLALLPGFSRTGATLAGGLVQKLDHQAAARFSFLLATPVIFAAAVLKLPKLLISPEPGTIGPMTLGFFASGIAAYISIRFLTQYFKTKTLKPFAWYCVIAGLLSFLVLVIK